MMMMMIIIIIIIPLFTFSFDIFCTDTDIKGMQRKTSYLPTPEFIILRQHLKDLSFRELRGIGV
jgi:hypothetical protein